MSIQLKINSFDSDVLKIYHLKNSDLSTKNKDLFYHFSKVKPDSIVCRMPVSIIPNYFGKILNDGGKIIVAEYKNAPVGFLVYVRDNNLSINFLRENKFKIVGSLLLSNRLTDKVLIFSNIVNSILMYGKSLPSDFSNEISLISVSSKFTGNGIGKKLLKYLLSFKLPIVRVKTPLNNAGALRFYLRNGFTKYGIIKVGLSKFIKLKFS